MAFTSREMKGSALTNNELDEFIGAIKVSQSSHGLAVGDVVRESSDSSYTKAQGNTEANVGVGLGLVVHVTDSNNFVLLRKASHQRVTITSHGYGSSFGDKLWLSSSTAGAFTATEPATLIGSIYLGYRVDANTIQWEPLTL